jgi:hypothetical protein
MGAVDGSFSSLLDSLLPIGVVIIIALLAARAREGGQGPPRLSGDQKRGAGGGFARSRALDALVGAGFEECEPALFEFSARRTVYAVVTLDGRTCLCVPEDEESAWALLVGVANGTQSPERLFGSWPPSSLGLRQSGQGCIWEWVDPCQPLQTFRAEVETLAELGDELSSGWGEVEFPGGLVVTDTGSVRGTLSGCPVEILRLGESEGVGGAPRHVGRKQVLMRLGVPMCARPGRGTSGSPVLDELLWTEGVPQEAAEAVLALVLGGGLHLHEGVLTGVWHEAVWRLLPHLRVLSRVVGPESATVPADGDGA